MPEVIDHARLVQQRNDAQQQEERGAAQAANQHIAVHSRPPCVVAHAADHQPNAQPNQQQRPGEFKDAPADIVQLAEQEQQPEADQNDGADRFLAPPVSLAEAAERRERPDRASRPPA